MPHSIEAEQQLLPGAYLNEQRLSDSGWRRHWPQRISMTRARAYFRSRRRTDVQKKQTSPLP